MCESALIVATPKLPLGPIPLKMLPELPVERPVQIHFAKSSDHLPVRNSALEVKHNFRQNDFESESDPESESDFEQDGSESERVFELKHDFKQDGFESKHDFRGDELAMPTTSSFIRCPCCSIGIELGEIPGNRVFVCGIAAGAAVSIGCGSRFVVVEGTPLLSN